MESKNILNPINANYNEKVKNKEIKKIPSNETEPKTHTNYK